MAEIKMYQAKIVKIVDETKDVKTFYLDPQAPFTFSAGQFVMISVEKTQPDGTLKQVKRAYSIASAPGEKFLALTIKLYSDGELSSKLIHYKIGDLLTLTGPYGKFLFVDPKIETVFIAGGTGVAPLRSMWQSLLESKSTTKMRLLYSTRFADEIIYKDELNKLSASGVMPSFITVTRPEEGYTGLQGRIDKHFVEKHVSDPKGSVYYICGAPAMVQDMKKALHDLDVAAEQIFHEAW